jgi:hypothetical protein
LPAAWGHFGDFDKMVLAALATIETGYACLPQNLPEIHNGLPISVIVRPSRRKGKWETKPGNTGGHTYTFHIPSSRSELPAAWDHFDDLDKMILNALAIAQTAHACLLKDLPEIHKGLLFQLPL